MMWDSDFLYECLHITRAISWMFLPHNSQKKKTFPSAQSSFPFVSHPFSLSLPPFSYPWGNSTAFDQTCCNKRLNLLLKLMNDSYHVRQQNAGLSTWTVFIFNTLHYQYSNLYYVYKYCSLFF